MKFAILGATGRTGGQLLKLALEADHQVVAVCRNLSKVTIKHENLQVVEGDVLSEASLTPLFQGCDAIFSCLGTDSGLFKATTFYSQSIKAIAAAMREAGVGRLVCMSSWFSNYDKSDGGSFYIEWFMKPMAHLILGRVLYDMRTMEEYILSSCQDLTYTVVRPPGLTDKPITDDKFQTKELQYVPDCKGMMSRADVARFMLESLHCNDFDKKILAIAI